MHISYLSVYFHNVGLCQIWECHRPSQEVAVLGRMLFKKSKRKTQINLFLTDNLFLPAVTFFPEWYLLAFQGGIFLFHMVDTYGLSRITLFSIACLETIVIAWVYGKSHH